MNCTTRSRNTSMTEPLKARVQAAVDLYTKGQVSAIVFSGSVPPRVARNRAEADVMQEYAAQVSGLNPNEERWYIERDSKTTYENAHFSAKIVEQERWHQVVVVTSPFHQMRSYWTFRKALNLHVERGWGVQLSVAKTPFVHHLGYGFVLDDIMDLFDFVRELGAIAKYKLEGRF